MVLARRDSRLSRRDSRLTRNDTRGGNLLLSGTVVSLDTPWLTMWFQWKPLHWSWWMVLGSYFISINLDWPTYMKCTLSPFKEHIKQTPLSRTVIVARKLSEFRFPNGWKFWEVRSSTNWQRSLWLVSVDAPWLTTWLRRRIFDRLGIEALKVFLPRSPRAVEVFG